MEDYVKAIYKVTAKHRRATTLLIAESLELSPASVTNMLKRLAKLGLVDYEPYQGAILTEAGTQIALEVIRHHRLLELYLTERLGFTWDEVDAEAETLEHVISEQFEDRIDELLGYPDTDPHGDPIPTRAGGVADRLFMPLASAIEGQNVVVRRVSDSDPDALRGFAGMGLVPDAEVAVLRVDEPTGQMRVRIGGVVHRVGPADAGQVFVEVV